MALPKIDLPIFDLKLVSLDKPIRFRPFLVKEEKLMLMALQSDEDDSIFKTIKQVVNNCILDDLDIDKLPIFDIEYLFLNIRARSMGEDIETYFMCQNVTEEAHDDVPEVKCQYMMPVKVNVLEIKPPEAGKPNKIYVADKVGIQLSYPTLRSFKPIEEAVMTEDQDKIFDMIYDCLDYVFDENNLYYKKETSKEEFSGFLESLQQDKFDKILEFFETLPKISHDITHVCEKCKFEHTLHLEGLNDFFT